MTILQVITDTDRRGAQVFALDLGTELVARGREVCTVALAPGSVGGLDVEVLGTGAKSPATLLALRRAMTRADVVIAHGSTTLPACALAGIGARTPFVYRQISDSRFWASTTARRLRVRAGLSRAAHVVALWTGSAHVLHDHFGVPSSRITVVPNGVPVDRIPVEDDVAASDLVRSLGLSAGRCTLLVVSALVPEKGVDLAVEGLAASDTTQLVVVGDGPERGRLTARAERVAPGRYAFVGQVDDVGPYYRAADLLVFPSRGGDSMPATLIEAGLAAVPAIATPVDAIPEVVVDGVTGVIVPIGDQAGLTAAIAYLSSSPDRRRRLGTAARQRCRAEFSIGAVATRWEAVLDGVLGIQAPQG